MVLQVLIMCLYNTLYLSISWWFTERGACLNVVNIPISIF